METSEERFKDWLDKNNIPYWYIEQSLETFSPALRELLIKRPDFMIILPNFGLIFVDIKDEHQAEKYDKFFLSVKEVNNYIEMQRIFNIPIWFILSNEEYHYKTWFWIPVVDIPKVAFKFLVKNENRESYSIPISEFTQVSDADNLQRIFSRLLRF